MSIFVEDDVTLLFNEYALREGTVERIKRILRQKDEESSSTRPRITEHTVVSLLYSSKRIVLMASVICGWLSEGSV